MMTMSSLGKRMPSGLIGVMLFCLPAVSLVGEVSLTRQDQRVDVEIDGKPFTSFYYNSRWPKPFLYPLRSPSGVQVTRHYPMKVIPGESNDHHWHRGLWFSHGDIQGVDFWRETGDRNSRYPLPVGRMAFRSLDKAESQGSSATVTATYDLVVGDGPSLGTATQTFTFYRAGGNNVIDAAIVVSADQGQCLKFGDTEEGTFAIRVADELREDQGATLLNAHGEAGTKNIWGKPSPWVDYSSTVQGEKLGIAIFDHPRNPKHPTHWHARGYGLFSANPFGEHDFYGDPARDGGLTIREGESATFRYRVIIHPGDAKSARIAGLYQQYVRQP